MPVLDWYDRATRGMVVLERYDRATKGKVVIERYIRATRGMVVLEKYMVHTTALPEGWQCLRGVFVSHRDVPYRAGMYCSFLKTAYLYMLLAKLAFSTQDTVPPYQ